MWELHVRALRFLARKQVWPCVQKTLGIVFFKNYFSCYLFVTKQSRECFEVMAMKWTYDIFSLCDGSHISGPTVTSETEAWGFQGRRLGFFLAGLAWGCFRISGLSHIPFDNYQASHKAKNTWQFWLLARGMPGWFLSYPSLPPSPPPFFPSSLLPLKKHTPCLFWNNFKVIE